MADLRNPHDAVIVIVVLLVALLLLTWKGDREQGELYPISEPSDIAGARTCLEHGFTWYTFEAGGVRCFRAEYRGAWNAEQTLLEHALDRS